MIRAMGPWVYPESRYYYDWYGGDYALHDRSDHEIKQDILDRIRTGPYKGEYDLDVSVEKNVAILTGRARSPLAKRAAGDDAWDTQGVTDVSNQLVVADVP